MNNDISRIAAYETKCTGCGACVNVCPAKAIRLVERNGYFLFPEIDQARCTHCGLCLKTCPSNQPRPEPSHPTNEKIVGCFVSDEKERLRSSSGGVFQALAKYVIGKGGLVCGARFTDGFHLRHVLIDKVEDLPPLQGSKYLQSNPGDSYSKIKSAVQQGRTVLFVGTPCQVAAVKAVVGDSEYLITADFCCHGVPPEKLFLQHIKEVTGYSPADIRDIRFRDKVDEGWYKFHFVVETAQSRYNVSYRDGEDAYLESFRWCLTTRRSCADCRYARLPRMSDFTLGDLWKVAESRLNIRDNKGVSLVVLNTSAACKIFEQIRTKLAVVRDVAVQDVSNTNNLQQCWRTPHPNRQCFFDALYAMKDGSVDRLMAEYLSRSDSVCLLNFHDAHANYGSVLAGYALQEKVKKIIGFSPVSIHLWPFYGRGRDVGDLLDFNREKIISTELMTNDQQLMSLNNYCRTFIVGPDVVWRNSGFVSKFDWMLLSFARFSKNICSYAASFGRSSLVDTRGGGARILSGQ